jgi:acetyl esterase/lipase
MSISERVFTQLLKHPPRNTNKVSAEKMDTQLTVKEQEIDGFKLLTIQGPAAMNKHIIFLHGGGYLAEAIKGHRYIIEKLAKEYAFKVSFVDYPLAPENYALKTVDVVKKAYRKIANEHREDTILLFGDSAGGGLALALLQELRNDKSIRMPLKTVLVSPWVDVSMSNPKIKDYTEKDVLLSVKGLKEFGKLYAGELNLKNPLVSPIFGNHENLGEFKIFVSDSELLYPDAVLLHNKLNAASGSSASIVVKEKMIHDWIVLPIKERDETIRDIAEFCNSQ